jgi:hypothetical protein
MSKHISSSACAAAVLSLTVAMAQTAAQDTRTARADAQELTVTGCVARGTGANQAGQFMLNNAVASNMPTSQIGAVSNVDARAAGVEATGTVAGGVAQPSTTESDQTPATERGTHGAHGAVGTSGHEDPGPARRETGATGGRTDSRTSSSVAAHPSAPAYVLIAGRDTLSKWVGQRVEITGRIAGANHPTGPAGTTGTAPSAASTPRLQVTSVRPVPGNCL